MNTDKDKAGCQCCDKCECYKEGNQCPKDGKKGEGCGCKSGCECCSKCNCSKNESCCCKKNEKKCCCGEGK